jgi:hypothetical protein
MTHLASLSTLPDCSRTSQTQATCSWVNPKEVREEWVGADPPTSPSGKAGKLDRH